MLRNILTRLNNRNKRKQRNALRNEYLEFIRTLPVEENSVMIEARDGDAFDGNAFYMLREILQCNEYKSLAVYVSARDEAAVDAFARVIGDTSRINFVIVGSREYYKAWATSKYLINDATISNFFIKRDGQKYLNLWHGTPLKCMGRRVAHEPHAIGNAQKNFVAADYLLYPNTFMMEHMEDDYMLSDIAGGKAVLSGYPRNSVFLDDARHKEVSEALGLSEYKIYAYMPTWRPSMMVDQMAEILAAFDDELSDDEILLAKIHPLASSGVDYSSFKHVRKFPSEFETYEALNISDCLITDYSSVFFDYAVTGRNIVLYAYDACEYLSARGLYLSFDSLPFVQTSTVSETLVAVRAGKQYDDSEFLSTFCSCETLDSPARLARLFFEGDVHSCRLAEFKHNGLPNKLICFGDLSKDENRETALSELAKLDVSVANYYLIFHRSELEENHEFLFKLPEGIRYFGCAGKMLCNSDEQKIIEAYKDGHIDFETLKARIPEAVQFEMLRRYGGMQIDELILHGDPVIK